MYLQSFYRVRHLYNEPSFLYKQNEEYRSSLENTYNGDERRLDDYESM